MRPGSALQRCKESDSVMKPILYPSSHRTWSLSALSFSITLF